MKQPPIIYIGLLTYNTRHGRVFSPLILTILCTFITTREQDRITITMKRREKEDKKMYYSPMY